MPFALPTRLKGEGMVFPCNSYKLLAYIAHLTQITVVRGLHLVAFAICMNLSTITLIQNERKFQYISALLVKTEMEYDECRCFCSR